MADGQRQDLEKGLRRPDDVLGAQPGRAEPLAVLVGVAGEHQPQPAILQVCGHVLREPDAVRLEAERVETTAVENETERRAFNPVFEEIGAHKPARGMRF